MSNLHKHHANISTSPGAKTLRDSLLRGCLEGQNTFSQKIDFWQGAIKGLHTKERMLIGKDKRHSEMVHSWYWGKETQSHSYQAPSFIISDKDRERFAYFRKDPYYHLKKMVEIIARHLVQEQLRSRGIYAMVYLASDADDANARVDVIVEEKKSRGKEFWGLDIAVSQNTEYITQKSVQKKSLCTEFNMYKGLGEMSIPRRVYTISPHTMARFLSSYMGEVAQYGSVRSERVLVLFQEAESTTVDTRSRVRSKTQDIMNHRRKS